MSEILAEVRGKVAAGAREIMLVGQTVNAYKEPANGADFADLLRRSRRHRRRRAHRVRLVASEGSGREAGARRRDPAEDEPALSSGGAVRLEPDAAAHEPQVHGRRVPRPRRDVSAATTRIGRSRPTSSSASRARPKRISKRTLDLCAAARFAQAYMFVYSPRRGTPAAHWEPVAPEVARERFARLVALPRRARAGLSRPQARHDRARARLRPLAQRPGPVRGQDDRQRHRAFSADREPLRTLSEPWVDVAVERAAVWGVAGIATGRARGFNAPARALSAPVIDLVGMR